MTENGEAMEILKVTIHSGDINVTFGTKRVEYLSHAIRLASLELDNMIIEQYQKKEDSAIVKATGLMDRLKRK